MVAKKIVGLIGVLAMVCVAAGTAYPSGYSVENDLWIRAVINTVEKGPVDAIWEKGGEAWTAGGDRVIWGYFHASPDDVTWGSQQNPDLFVKIWFDRGGRVDVNFFHVSVPDITVFSIYAGSDRSSTATMSRRYVRQYYLEGQGHEEEGYEDGNPPEGYWPAENPSKYAVTDDLRIGAIINTVEKGRIHAVWHKGGDATTAGGHRVVWGYFYANSYDVIWGSENNPDLFVKIWFDAAGRTDVNFFHVSVPDIEVCSAQLGEASYDQKGTAIMGNRYIRHEYQWNPAEPGDDRLSADAGSDQRVTEGSLVTLDASASRNVGTLYWEQIGGTPVTLSDDMPIKPSFTAPDILRDEEWLTFRLTVTDSSGYQLYDTCVVQVVNVAVSKSVTNFLGMTFNLIPAATFSMGSPLDEMGRGSDEPLHTVTLTQPFYMQTTEVTQGQWKALVGGNPFHFQNCDNCPAESLSWHDVEYFIGQLNRIAEGTYRLPTEAEWEYAARAGTPTAFVNGGITASPSYFCKYDSNLNRIGWYCGNSNNRTHPVAQKQPNAWGLYDMSGNVWEWCLDWYDAYPTGSVTDPAGPDSGWGRVLRGGGWSDHVSNCRSANRLSLSPDERYNDDGFRLVFFPGQ